MDAKRKGWGGWQAGVVGSLFPTQICERSYCGLKIVKIGKENSDFYFSFVFFSVWIERKRSGEGNCDLNMKKETKDRNNITLKKKKNTATREERERRVLKKKDGEKEEAKKEKSGNEE